MSKICRNLGIKYIGVATLGEAIQIRNSGDKGKILGWLYDVNSNQIKDAVKNNIDIGVFDDKHIPIISKSLPKGTVANIHLFVDTGIDRNGVPYDRAINAAIQITKDPKLKLVGLMSHLCCAETKNNAPTNKQYKLFRDLIKKLDEINIHPEVLDISATNGILNYDNSGFNLVRAGAGFYGLEKNKNLTPILSLSSQIIQIKVIPKGQGIGYDRKYITHSDEDVAIVPIGYADILPITKNEKMSVYVNGTERKVLGLESMDQLVIQSRKGDKIGDIVKFFGDKKKGYKIDLLDFAKQNSTPPFNIITHLGERVNKIYI
jgi:alanine racemase